MPGREVPGFFEPDRLAKLHYLAPYLTLLRYRGGLLLTVSLLSSVRGFAQFEY